MFEKLEPAPSDPILGLSEAFAKDTRPGKINLSVGVYKDEGGVTPILDTVREAERSLLETTRTKSYKPIDGDPAFGRCVRSLLFGEQSALVDGGLAATCHTPGGTGALRLAADFLAKAAPSTRVWMSEPTWANHPKIFEAAGLPCRSYRYFDAQTNALDAEGMLEALGELAPGDVVLLHACCHNPTGVDPSADDWRRLATLLADRGALPLIDFAYQGFGDGLEQDAVGLRALVAAAPEALVCSSYSKNFGLYNERTGALTFTGQSPELVSTVLSQLKTFARTNYSNPPAHGGAIVATILGDATLRARWEAEVAAMRDRINRMRTRFVDTLRDKGAKGDYSFIARQRGMFSFSGLKKDQVERLRSEFAIYIVGSGRINVAGMSEDNLGPLCDAIVAVTS